MRVSARCKEERIEGEDNVIERRGRSKGLRVKRREKLRPYFGRQGFYLERISGIFSCRSAQQGSLDVLMHDTVDDFMNYKALEEIGLWNTLIWSAADESGNSRV